MINLKTLAKAMMDSETYEKIIALGNKRAANTGISNIGAQRRYENYLMVGSSTWLAYFGYPTKIIGNFIIIEAQDNNGKKFWHMLDERFDLNTAMFWFYDRNPTMNYQEIIQCANDPDIIDEANDLIARRS